MRLLKILVFGLFLISSPVWAQEEEAVYRVSDVTVDITADNAAQARDKAIAQAQRQGFDLLLTRLGVGGKGGKASDEALTAMVKAFDLQKEYAAGKRYTGTFTLHFKPEAVRAFLSERGADYVEERAAPYVVLPIARLSGRDVLWEDRTVWRNVWEEMARGAGLVPLIVPAGELDDIAQISTAEALSGRAEKLQTLLRHYQAGGALVALYNEEKATIETSLYDEAGAAHHGAIKAEVIPEEEKNRTESLKSGIKKIMAALDEAWREGSLRRNETGKVPSSPAAASLPVEAPTASFVPAPSSPSLLSVSALVPTLAAWAQIRNALAQSPSVISTHVITMTRGLVHFELQFRGELTDLRSSLEERGLILEQGAQGGWAIQRRLAPEEEM